MMLAPSSADRVLCSLPVAMSTSTATKTTVAIQKAGVMRRSSVVSGSTTDVPARSASTASALRSMLASAKWGRSMCTARSSGKVSGRIRA